MTNQHTKTLRAERCLDKVINEWNTNSDLFAGAVHIEAYAAQVTADKDKRIEELEAEVERSKKKNALKSDYCKRKHAFCCDCRDKLPNNNCWRCGNQTLQAANDKLTQQVATLRKMLGDAITYIRSDFCSHPDDCGATNAQCYAQEHFQALAATEADND